MEIKEFAELIREEMERKTGWDIRLQEVRKNNNVILHGISIKEPSCNMAPTIYLESYFEDYGNGRSIDSVVASIFEIVQDDTRDKSWDMSWFRDFKNVRDKVAYKLVNYEANTELLNTIPYERYLDLAKIYYVSVKSEEFGSGTILIHNSHLDMWGINEEELGVVANENTPKLLPAEISSLCDVMKSLIGEDDMFSECIDAFVDCPMHVASNPTRIFGASVMCYPDAIKEIAEKLESNLYILPSSTHEIIIVLPKEDDSAAALKAMVYEVNRTQLAEEDILSDSVYYYNREKDTITIA